MCGTVGTPRPPAPITTNSIHYISCVLACLSLNSQSGLLSKLSSSSPCLSLLLVLDPIHFEWGPKRKKGCNSQCEAYCLFWIMACVTQALFAFKSRKVLNDGRMQAWGVSYFSLYFFFFSRLFCFLLLSLPVAIVYVFTKDHFRLQQKKKYKNLMYVVQSRESFLIHFTNEKNRH